MFASMTRREGKRFKGCYFCECDRMSGLWGPQSSLDLYLQEEGIETLFMSGVNADQVRIVRLSITICIMLNA